ncbi:hypothetical protein SAMN06265222_101340 [Neorhodopirellula lusitana]|uniref:TVP38/TMEM64 family membrane protein n=1 Tax=Neorhodopirellula lusitana TaxID=445327 RepID=A0ABY1PS00_9BACT|nr:DedA family protein [Neorhodopirellula lusitana]SMP39663.1 hypothetical protein SAMN06265222_101340 [Neorhodopirellula lusitana]
MTKIHAVSPRIGSSRRWVPATILALGLLGLASGQSLDTAGRWLELSRVAGPLAFIALGTLLMCFFVPKTLISLAAGSMFGVMEGSWVLSATAVAAAMINYHIGRWSLRYGHHTRYGHHGSFKQSNHNDRQYGLGDGPHHQDEAQTSHDETWHNHHIGEQPTDSDDSPHDIDTARGKLLHRIATTAHQAGLGFHLLVRLTPIPTTVISYAMGAASARQIPYVTAALLASIPQWLWVYCAASASEGSPSTAKWFSIGCSAFAAIALSFWIPRQLLRVKEI